MRTNAPENDNATIKEFQNCTQYNNGHIELQELKWIQEVSNSEKERE